MTIINLNQGRKIVPPLEMAKELTAVIKGILLTEPTKAIVIGKNFLRQDDGFIVHYREVGDCVELYLTNHNEEIIR